MVLSAVQAAQASAQEREAVPQGAHGLRNPHALRAVQVLERQKTVASRRLVRFEWDQVRGAREYLLVGHWTQPPSWTMHSSQFHVSRRSATSWTPERVTFEIPLAEGSHAWKIVALFGTNSVGDSAHATPYSFDVR